MNLSGCLRQQPGSHDHAVALTTVGVGVRLTCRALFRKQLFCPGSLLRPLLGAMEVMVLGVASPCTPPAAPPPDAK